MLRLLKNCWWILLLVLGAPSAWGFSMWGVREPFHVIQLSYIGDYSFTPKNLGEESRWNLPNLYYTYDQAFYDYFGSNGVAAVDSAVDILNNLNNVSSYSQNLSEFPLESTRLNWTASAMHLFDLKSCALENLVERLGLTDPERFTWTLRNRALPPGASCPAYYYTVIKRNFDPLTLIPSSYVNGNLFTYYIIELCPAVDQADAIEVLVDPTGIYGSAVATPKMSVADFFYYGYFYNGLTRDDVGGLRYLYSYLNRNIEAAGPATFTYVTNTAVSQLLASSNLTLFAQQAYSNNAAALNTLYPNLVILGTTNLFTNIYTTNFTAYFTNYPWDPVGTPAHVAFITNVTASVQTVYQHTFGNLLSIYPTPGGWAAAPLLTVPPPNGQAYVTIQTTTVGFTNYPWAPLGTSNTVFTNFATTTYLTNDIVGDIILLPTNLCSFVILNSQLTNVVTFTNPVVSATNFVFGTNQQSLTQDMITYYTNHFFVINPVECPTNNVALREGIEKVNFIRRDYDSLFNRFWYPITNQYSVWVITNNTRIQQTLFRVVTTPDILFSAADIVSDPTTWPILIPTVQRLVPPLDTTGSMPNIYGPVTILSSNTPNTLIPAPTFTFNKVGPIFLNRGPFFIDEKQANLQFIWASFDGTTNAPVIYPVGTSIWNLQNQVLMQFGPPSLTDASVGQYYWQKFTGSGGQPPYTFGLSPGSPGLPPGFDATLPDGTFVNGMIAGTPVQDGTFDFYVRMTDAAGRFVDRPYSININVP